MKMVWKNDHRIAMERMLLRCGAESLAKKSDMPDKDIIPALSEIHGEEVAGTGAMYPTIEAHLSFLGEQS